MPSSRICVRVNVLSKRNPPEEVPWLAIRKEDQSSLVLLEFISGQQFIGSAQALFKASPPAREGHKQRIRLV